VSRHGKTRQGHLAAFPDDPGTTRRPEADLPITLPEGGHTEGSQGNRVNGSPPFLQKIEVGETAPKAGFPSFSNGAKRQKNESAKRPYKKEERENT